MINNILKLSKGTLVIHLKHGIGKYEGLKIIEHNNIKSEYLTILYANNDKLYVPIYHIYLIKKYISINDNKTIKLHVLGNLRWKKERKRIFKVIQDIAVNILDNHAIRISKPGFSFQINQIQYELFCKNFPFCMTQDQNDAMEAVLSDMNKSIPMDRLICGDVGFGKTEIAIRASFIAVSNKKQVIILVPTTLLAQQHYKNFQDRFQNWNIKLDIFSRFQSKKEQINCINNIQKGYTNILISTHKVLSKNLIWHDLGLLVIDEEHRFGVYQKEKIKNHFSNIDILTLTATPIPRTLNMAINQIRDLSIIATPPKNRLPVKTFIKKNNIKLIKKIILKELLRKGQVYYICNKIYHLEKKINILQQNIPEAKFKIAHGQMKGKTLKKIIYDFYQKKFDVLICTTIIETGIDIPTVNTIIIENAHSFGLAQLHQMRGRVGRSDIQAYAWLLIPDFEKISLNGRKRLKAIQSIKNFGAGLELSMHDLKIRGTGELLGYHQSGHIKSIEFSLYMELLQNTIELIKNKNTLSLTELKKNQPEIYLSVTHILPEEYISDVDIRLNFYKELFLLNDFSSLSKIKLELINKFGILPQETKNLILFIKIKIFSNHLNIVKIKSNSHISIINFSKEQNVKNINILVKLLKQEIQGIKIKNIFSIELHHDISNDYQRIKWILHILKKIKKILSEIESNK